MTTVLRIYGRDMDSDEVMRHCPVEPCSVGRSGEALRPLPSSPIRQQSNVNLLISDAGFGEIEEQVSEAIEFLTKHDKQLRAMLGVSGVESALIHFGLKWQDTYTHTDQQPAELIRLAGALNLSIHLSHYPISDPEDEELAMVP